MNRNNKDTVIDAHSWLGYRVNHSNKSVTHNRLHGQYAILDFVKAAAQHVADWPFHLGHVTAADALSSYGNLFIYRNVWFPYFPSPPFSLGAGAGANPSRSIFNWATFLNPSFANAPCPAFNACTQQNTPSASTRSVSYLISADLTLRDWWVGATVVEMMNIHLVPAGISVSVNFFISAFVKASRRLIRSSAGNDSWSVFRKLRAKLSFPSLCWSSSPVSSVYSTGRVACVW